MTQFTTVYNRFLGKITDDMYLELTQEDTEKMLFEVFEKSLHFFEFPRVDIYDYNVGLEEYNIVLSREEINIAWNMAIFIFCKKS